MTRVEFCRQMAEIRKASPTKLRDLCVCLDMLPSNIYRLENGKNNLGMLQVVQYLIFFDYCIAIQVKLDTYIIDNEQKVSDAMMRLRIQTNLSQREFAERIGITYAMVGYVEKHQRSLTLDSLLKICEAFNFTIQIIKKEVQD